MAAPNAKLDVWGIVAHTSRAEAHLALALDLREQGLQDVEAVSTCKALRVLLLSSNLLNRIAESVFTCRKLRKLDLSANGLANLPPKEEWARLEELQVLYLHENPITSLHDVGSLAGAPAVVRVTLYECPVSKHPSYRHFCVNTIFSLRCLDLHVISDEELIEGTAFPEALNTKCRRSELALFGPPPPSDGGEPAEHKDEARLLEVADEVRSLNRIHAQISPVLRLQAYARAVGARRSVRLLRQRVAARQAVGGGAAPEVERGEQGAAKRGAASNLLKGDTRSADEMKAASVSYERGEKEKALLTTNLAAPMAHHEANLGLQGAPYLYIQTRHVLELEALLPAALGPEAAGQCYFEPTDTYVIRHSHETPKSLAEPPLTDLLIRQRAVKPGKIGLRLKPTAREAYALDRLQRYARPTRKELRVIDAAVAHATRDDDTPVQAVYARRQLVRLVLPSASMYDAIFAVAQQRNAHLLDAMGVPMSDALSPKVISELMVPLTPAALDVVLATVTLQRVWRSISARQKLRPTLTQRLMRVRAATRMQRWWRWWLLKERLRMLLRVRERVLAVDSNKLYIPTHILEDIEGRLPLHAKELWPEHSSLKFTFALAQQSDLQYFVLPDALRPEMPLWCAPRMPTAQTRSLNQPQEVLSLLTVGVRAALVTKESMRPFVHRDWTCIAFTSLAEASRRVALITALGYEPLAHRTIHGRLQGRFFHPLFLYSWDELERHEAAACIQAFQLARGSRRVLRHVLNQARSTRAEVARQREVERDSNSLLAQKGPLDVIGITPPPMLTQAAKMEAAPRLNLSKEQLERMLAGQAQVLGVYGLPPTVSESEEIGPVLAEQLAREAANQREATAAARELIRERREAEIAAAREVTFAAARPAPPTAQALMAMMHAAAAVRADAYDDMAAAQARYAESKRSQAASLRAELKQAHAELLADKELERQELLVQSRLERRQLQHALDERNRAFAAEVSEKREARIAQRGAQSGRTQGRAFSGSFVSQQNAMVRQLQLGDIRRRRAEQVEESAVVAAAARKEQEAWKARAASESRRRAEAAREGQRQEKAAMAKKREALHSAHERELEMIRLKQAQLRDIRMMLARPLDGTAPGGGSLEMDLGGTAPPPLHSSLGSQAPLTDSIPRHY